MQILTVRYVRLSSCAFKNSPAVQARRVKEQIALFHRNITVLPTSIVVVGCTVAEATFQLLGLGLMKKILVHI